MEFIRKLLNYTKCANNNSTAVHILGHKGNRVKWGWKKGGIKKRAKKHRNMQKIWNFFTIFERDTFINWAIACIKRPKTCSELCKMHQLHIKCPLFLYFYQYRRATSTGEGGRSPLPFFETRRKVPWFCKKSALILEKIPFLYASIG